MHYLTYIQLNHQYNLLIQIQESLLINPCLNEIQNTLDERNVEYDEILLRDNKIVLKFQNIDQQLESKTILQNKLFDRVIVALNLEPTTPDWLKDLEESPLNLV